MVVKAIKIRILIFSLVLKAFIQLSVVTKIQLLAVNVFIVEVRDVKTKTNI